MSPIEDSFSMHLVDNFRWYSRLGYHVRVTFRVDASSESGADFFYDMINAPTRNCAIIFNKAYFTWCLNLSSVELYHIYC